MASSAVHHVQPSPPPPPPPPPLQPSPPPPLQPAQRITAETKEALRAFFSTMSITKTTRLPREGHLPALDALIAQHDIQRDKVGYQLRRYKEAAGLIATPPPNASKEELRAWLDCFGYLPQDVFDAAITRLKDGPLAEAECFGDGEVSLLRPTVRLLHENTVRVWEACLCDCDCDASAFELAIRKHRRAFFAWFEANVVPHNRALAVHVHGAMLSVWREMISLSTDLPTTPANAADKLDRHLVYYIAGWLLCWVSKRTAHDSESLARFARCRCTREEAKVLCLPSALVEARERHDGLVYPTAAFFNVVLRMEAIFSHSLTFENALRLGSGIMKIVGEHVCADATLVALAKQAAPCKLELLVDGYMRMRGKDFVFKLSSAASHENDASSTRGRLAALADEARRRATLAMKDDVQT
ncbi:hypothetical protein RI054_20g89820 [Pseudoscourfieldia marina]